MEASLLYIHSCVRFSSHAHSKQTALLISRLPVELRIKVYEYTNVRAIETGEYYTTKWFTKPWSRTILLAGILNDQEALEIASIQGEDAIKMMCELLALAGNLTALQWARRSNSQPIIHYLPDQSQPQKRSRVAPLLPWNARTCSNAVAGGHLELLKWAREQGCPVNQHVCIHKAIECGHLDVLRWLHHNQKFTIPKDACLIAASRGHLDMLKWLHEYQHYCRLDERSCTMAASRGHLRVLKWLNDKNCPLCEETCAYAILGGDLEVLQWLHEQNCPWDQRCCIRAAANGSLNILQWLCDVGYVCDYDEMCATAAHYGHFHVLNWLREQKCQ